MTNNEKLAQSIARALDRHHSAQDVAIYYDNKRLGHFGDSWEIEEDMKGSDYTEWANDDTITMTFEGPLYDAMNYGLNETLINELRALVKRNGYYWELGNAWNLALHEL